MDPWAYKYPFLSPYNYVSNNPLIYFDPDGRGIYDIPKHLAAIWTPIATVSTVVVADDITGVGLIDNVTLPAIVGVGAVASAGVIIVDVIDEVMQSSSSTSVTEDGKSEAPPANDGLGPQHGKKDHDDKINQKVNDVKEKGHTDIRKHQSQVDANGKKVGDNKPDVQSIDKNGKRQIYEVDRDTKSSQKHENTIKKNDPNANVQTEIIK